MGSVPGQLPASDTAHIGGPKALSDVRIGMDKDVVLAALSEHNAVVKWSSLPGNKDVPGAQEYDSWVVFAKGGPIDGPEYVKEQGSVTFSNGKVRETDEFLAETESPDTARFVRELSSDLGQHAKPVANIGAGVGSMRVLEVPATIEIEEDLVPMGTERQNMSIVRIQLKDVTYQLSVSDSSDSSIPVVKIRRIRRK
jgi:hypothetical protein